MKKTIIAAMSMIFIIYFTGCQANPTETTTLKENVTTGTEEAETTMDFKAQYIRTDGGSREKMNYPYTAVIQSAEELTAYYNANKNTYNLEHRQSPAGSGIGFLDAIDIYNDAFFKDNLLVLVLLEEPSGSNRHEVTSVEKNNNGTEINIVRNIPRIGTADMAEWHIIIELKKADYNGSKIKVNLTKQIKSN